MRFPLGVTFAFMLAARFSGKAAPVWGLLIIFMAVSLSDLLDGFIARHFGCKSDIGAVLDVTADSFFILLSLVVSNCFHVVPVWFTAAIVLKLADFILSSRMISAGENGHFVFDLLGRFTAVGFYLMPLLAGIFPYSSVITAAALFLVFSAVCSSILRWSSFVRQTYKKSMGKIQVPQK